MPKLLFVAVDLKLTDVPQETELGVSRIPRSRWPLFVGELEELIQREQDLLTRHGLVTERSVQIAASLEEIICEQRPGSDISHPTQMASQQCEAPLYPSSR